MDRVWSFVFFMCGSLCVSIADVSSEYESFKIPNRSWWMCSECICMPIHYPVHGEDCTPNSSFHKQCGNNMGRLHDT